MVVMPEGVFERMGERGLFKRVSNDGFGLGSPGCLCNPPLAEINRLIVDEKGKG